MCQAVCIPNFEILPSSFHFHVPVFLFDDHDACSFKHVAAVGKWVGVRCFCSVRVVHDGQDGRMRISKCPFNFSLSSWVCMFWQEMTSAHNEAVVHRSVEGMPKGSAHPSTAKNDKKPWEWLLTNLVLDTRVHVISYSRREDDTNEWPSSRMINSWLSCSCCIRRDESKQKGPLYIV